MASVTHPDKQRVRDLMQQHREERTPPLTPEQVREQLGWRLIQDEQKAAAK